MDMKDYQYLAHETSQYPDLTDLVGGLLKSVDCRIMFVGNQINPFDNDVWDQISRNPYYPALGLAGEVGEFCNKLKKVMRDQGGRITDEFREKARGELGDILWYLAECATELDLDLEQIAEENIDKLHSRKARGKIQGEGDNR
jgi:NTP pyrophosphatase (non-canonical NTP hydrolase)